MDYSARFLIDDLAPLEIDIGITPLVEVVGIFLLLGVGFFIMQLRKEYYWLKSIGGSDAFFDVDDI